MAHLSLVTKALPEQTGKKAKQTRQVSTPKRHTMRHKVLELHLGQSTQQKKLGSQLAHTSSSLDLFLSGL